MSTSFHFKLKSHPNKLLYDHLKNVAEISRDLVLSKDIKYRDFTADIAYILGVSHDFGKSTKFFQEKLNRYNSTEMARHSLISAIFAYYITREYIHSFEETPDFRDEMPFISYLVVARHHSDLRDIQGSSGEKESLKDKKDFLKEQLANIKENSFDEMKEIYSSLLSDLLPGFAFQNFIDNFDALFDDIIRMLRRTRRVKGDSVSFYLKILFLYSVLLDADKMDAAGIERPDRLEHIPGDIVDEYRRRKFTDIGNEITKLRDKAYEEVIASLDNLDLQKDRKISIELPTGTGKTLLALSYSIKLRNMVSDVFHFTPRIIYSLPFLSIIDQNSKVLMEVLAPLFLKGSVLEELYNGNDEIIKVLEEKIPSKLLVKHHHLADMLYKTEEKEYDVDKSILLSEGWNSEIVITTFFQLFHSIITNRNRAARKFHNIVNSIIILDEVQAIPIEYWELVNRILTQLTKEYNTWIILMTATQPLIFSKEELKPVVSSSEYYTKMNRARYNIEKQNLSFSDFRDRVFDEIMNSSSDIIVIMNKVRAVKDLYDYIKDKWKTSTQSNEVVDENGICFIDGNAIVNLSTHIIPHHRIKRINMLNKIKERKIIITTQLIEAGVDVSASIVYRDLSPLDSIIQAGGRCNRHYEDGPLGGEVRIVEIKDDRHYLWSSIYDVSLIGITKSLLLSTVDEREIIDIVKKYYHEIRNTKVQNDAVLESLSKMQYSVISKFRLIKENYPKFDVFIEIDEESKELFQKYKELYDSNEYINPIVRKKQFLGFKKRFYDYVISVPEKLLESLHIPVIHGVGYLSNDEVIENKKYDLETGISSGNMYDPFII